MSNLRKAAEQALETLEDPWKAGAEGVADAIVALRAVLAEPVESFEDEQRAFNAEDHKRADALEELVDPYPFAGQIKMSKIVKDGKEVIQWENVDMSQHASGNLGIGDQKPIAFTFTDKAAIWARVDKDSNVTHLDMDRCAKGPHNAYTALAIAIWNKAIETVVDNFELEDSHYDEVRDSILRNKK